MSTDRTKEGAEVVEGLKESNEGLDSLRRMNLELQAEVTRLVASKEAAAAMTTPPAYGAYPLMKAKSTVGAVISTYISEHVECQGLGFDFGQVPSNVDAHFCILPRSQGEKADRQRQMTVWREQVLPALIQELPAKLGEGVQLQITGIYLNVKLDEKLLLKDIMQMGVEPEFGNSDLNRGKSAVVDFSSPNIAKTMHVGHLRSTIIGQVLVNLLESTGAITYGVNHLGDWGTQFGQLVSAYQRWAGEVAVTHNPESNPVGFLAELYRKIKQAIKDEEATGRTELADEGRRNFALLEKGDAEVIRLWNEFRRLSLLEFDKLYKRLGVSFDTYLGEAYYEDKMEEVVAAATENGVAQKDAGGALVVDLSERGIPTFLLRKSDGGSNYVTRDLAALRHRPKLFNADEVLYVVGNEQSDHFKGVFALSEELGDIKPGQAEHVGFGMITREGKKIASREGAGGLDQLLDELSSGSLRVLQGKYPEENPEKLKQAAEAIGKGALVYRNFMQTRERNMDFDPEEMLDMSQQSGPYLQYTFLRIQRLLEQIGPVEDFERVDGKVIEDLPPEVKALILESARFPEVLVSTTKARAPHMLAEYLYGLCSDFNSMYSKGKKGGRMMDMDADRKVVYERSLKVVLNVVGRGISILNMEIPAVM